MNVATRQIEDVLILDLDGPLTTGVGDEALRQSVNSQVVQGHQKILVNLSGVSRIDSTGIGQLVASIKMANRFGTVIKLVKIGSKVRHILNLSRLLPLLDFYEHEVDALRSFEEVDPASEPLH